MAARIVQGGDDLSRAARRRLERLAIEVDQALVSDRRFFERHPHRSYRVRRAAKAEIASAREIGEARGDIPKGFAWFTAVRAFAPGVRARVFFGGPANNDTDVSETEAEWLYRRGVQENPTVRFANEHMEAVAASLRERS